METYADGVERRAGHDQAVDRLRAAEHAPLLIGRYAA
jgi:hypothetical protein